MYDTIVVPTDGSEHAVHVAEHAAALARAFDASIHVIYVVDLQTEAGPFSAGGVDDEFVERLEAEGQAAIDAVEARVGMAGREVHTGVLRGRPSEAILDYAADSGADLIAMGTHGRTGVPRYVAGSVTERVVRHADVPVLTARATGEVGVAGEYHDVLIPTDGSKYAAVAVEHGLGIARQFDARVHIVNIVDIGSITDGPDAAPPTDLVDRLRSDGERAVEEVAEQARESDVDVTTAVREGFPASDLLEYADENGIDLVAIGTAGRTGPSQYLIGSTAERVVRHAEMPVLAVNARDRDEG